MVKSYTRYEQSDSFGVVSSSSNFVYVAEKGSSGRVYTGALEDIHIWNLKTGELVKKLGQEVKIGSYRSKTSSAPPVVSCLQYHELTGVLAAGYSDGSVKIWDIASESVLIVFNGHKSEVTQLLFDESGTRLCSGSKDCSIILWDLVSESGMFKLKGHKDQITGLQFLRNKNGAHSNLDDLEDWLVSTAKDGLIKLWDLKARVSVETHVAHSGECWSFDYDHESQLLVTSGMENQLKIWFVDMESNKTKLVEQGVIIKASNARATHLQFCQVADLIVLMCQNADKTVEIFRVRSGEELAKFVQKKQKKLLEKTPDMDAEELKLQLHNSKTSMVLQPISVFRSRSKIRYACWAKCSAKRLQLVYSSIQNTLELCVLDLPSHVKKMAPGTSEFVGKYAVELPGHRTDVRAVDVSFDGKMLATASNGELKIWNIVRNSCIKTMECDYALCCKFLPGDRLVILGTKSGALQLFDLVNSELIWEQVDAHLDSIWTLDISDDGKQVVTGSADKSVKVWNVTVVQEHLPESDTKVAKLQLENAKTLQLDEDVLCVRLTASNKYLCCSLLDNTVKIFHFENLKFYLSLYGHKLPVLSLDVSDDSKLVVTSSADKNIKIWGLDFGDCHKSIFAHEDSIMSVKFLPGSHNYFSCSKDGTVKYWDGDKFECVQKLAAHQSEVWALALEKLSGEFVVSVSHDHSIRVWRQSDDEVFIEEEREKEMDEQYEEELLEDRADKNDADGETQEADAVEAVNKKTAESLKDGEKIMEALDLCTRDRESWAQYESQMKQYQAGKSTEAPIKPERNAILVYRNLSAEEYMFETVVKIKQAHLEDALLVLPYSYSLQLLAFLDLWCQQPQKYLLNGGNLAIVSKLAIFVIQINFKQLVSSKDAVVKNQLSRVKSSLRYRLQKVADIVGYNTEALVYAKSEWESVHHDNFSDDNDNDTRGVVKRSYEKVV